MNELLDIVAACRKNDRSAQGILYARLAPSLLGICIRYLRQRDEAEDVLQDSFVKIFTSLPSFRDEGSFEGWAKRITVNTALNALKKKKRLKFESELCIMEQVEIPEESEGTIDPEMILACLDTLPDGYRTIINLFLIEEYSHREIAEKLKIQEGTSRSQYSRAIQALMKAFKKKNETAIPKKA